MAKSILMVMDPPRGSVARSSRRDLLETWRAFFEREGLRLETLPAKTEAGGLRGTLDFGPDLVLLDRLLRNFSSLEFVKKIRQDPRGSHIPVIVVSSGSELSDWSHDVSRFLIAGAQDYIEIGTPLEEITARIATSIGDASLVPGGRMTVVPKFYNRIFDLRARRCLVLMPYRESWSERVWRTVSEAVGTTDYECVSANELRGDDVLEDIWTEINSAGVLVADISGSNPNVMYEAGIAHTIGKRVIFLQQRGERPVFDIFLKRRIEYSCDDEGLRPISRFLPDLLTESS